MSMFDDGDDPKDPRDPGGDGGGGTGGSGDPWSADDLAAAKAWATDYIKTHKIPEGWGNVDDLVRSYQEQRRQGKGHDEAMGVVPGLLGWDKYQAPVDPVKDSGGGGQTGGGGFGTGSLTSPFTDQYTPFKPQDLPTLGDSQVTIGGAPQFPNIPRFTSPTMEEAMNDPGYKFALQQGDQNLQNWAGARGTLNDSSTAKAFVDYGQAAATQQYGSVWDRAYKGYGANVETQYLQPFEGAYRNWMTGTVGPTMTNFSTQAANRAHLNDVGWQDNWNAFIQKYNQFKDQRDSTFDKQFKVATA